MKRKNIGTNYKNKNTVQKRGYYYSTANINKRKERNNENIINEDSGTGFKQNNLDKFENFVTEKPLKNNIKNFSPKRVKEKRQADLLPTPHKIKYNNDLENYDKNLMLLNFIDEEKKAYSKVLNKIKGLNNIISEIIIKPKIKNNEINKKIIRDKEKKEKEDINFDKNISDKIDEALKKANMALDNIKILGKAKIITNDDKSEKVQINNTNKNITNFEANSEKNKLINIAQNCLDKYVDQINFNVSIHDDYFIKISKKRKLIKEAKDSLQSLKYRLRDSPIIFTNIYTCIYNKNQYTYKKSYNILYKNLFAKENSFLKFFSIMNNELFKKLYNKVFSSEKPIDKINEDDINNIYSLWWIISEMKNCLTNLKENENDIFFKEYDYIIPKKNKNNNILFNRLIFDLIEKFIICLNNQNKINEEQLFDLSYHKMKEIFYQTEEIKIANFILKNNFFNVEISDNNIKEELNYFRNLVSIFFNKGKYICNITEK